MNKITIRSIGKGSFVADGLPDDIYVYFCRVMERIERERGTTDLPNDH